MAPQSYNGSHRGRQTACAGVLRCLAPRSRDYGDWALLILGRQIGPVDSTIWRYPQTRSVRMRLMPTAAVASSWTLMRYSVPNPRASFGREEEPARVRSTKARSTFSVIRETLLS